MGAIYCDACGSGRENATVDVHLASGLPSNFNKNSGNCNADEEVVVVEPEEVTAEVWKKENSVQQQALDVEIGLETMTEDYNVKKQRRRHWADDDDKGVM